MVELTPIAEFQMFVDRWLPETEIEEHCDGIAILIESKGNTESFILSERTSTQEYHLQQIVHLHGRCYQVARSIGKDVFDEVVLQLTTLCLPADHAVTGEADFLDGDAYFVVRRTNGTTTRTIFSGQDDTLSQHPIELTLDALLKRLRREMR